MALNPNRPRAVKMYVKPVVKATRTAIGIAFDQVVKEMHASIQKKLSKGYPPASTAGNYPHQRRPGVGLADTFEVVREGYEIKLKTPAYGIWLETGTRKMAARPWILRNMVDRKAEWSKKITKYAKAAMK